MTYLCTALAEVVVCEHKSFNLRESHLGVELLIAL